MGVDEKGRGLRAVAWISAVYDFALGLPLLVAPLAMAEMMGAGPVQPVINGQLNGLFTFALGLGYLWAARDVQARRGYLWIAGVFAKAAGAALFVYDHFARHSPDGFLLFAATDGTLAVVTLVALLRSRELLRLR
jgi:hypothetical protein